MFEGGGGGSCGKKAFKLPGGEHSTKFYTETLRPEVPTLTLLYTIFDRKGIPFAYLPQKIVSLSYTY